MAKKPTPKQLAALVKRQRTFVAACGTDAGWERIDRTPWYRYRAERKNPAELMQADLRGLDLRGLELPCANLRQAVAPDQDFTGAKLDGGLLREGHFAGSSFRSASLRGVDLTEAWLARCDFTDADLTGAVFVNAELTGARIDWAAAGPGRFRVEREDGVATGGFGELEQDYVWVVTDQKAGRKVARFEGHIYQCYFSSDPPQYSGALRVEIAPDAQWMVVSYGDKVERKELPP